VSEHPKTAIFLEKWVSIIMKNTLCKCLILQGLASHF
jgi:hypothetical protein